MAELKKCFTPVRLTALQTRAFHDRVQGAKETVDAYAQELRKLFSKAYATTTRGGSEAEKMGQTVLASQFVSGLRSELKSKVVGSEGSLEQLLAKARFEEAKRKELLNVQPPKRPTPAASGQNQNQNQGVTPSMVHPVPTQREEVQSRPGKCYRCGRPGHVARACPYPKPSKGQEAHGCKEPAVANVTTAKETGQEERKIEELRRELHEAELAAGLKARSGTIRTVTWSDGGGSILGPTVTTSVEVNGLRTEALFDTGSTVTIMSFDFALDVVAKERPHFSSVEEWRTEARKQFLPPTVSLKNYSGGRLDILAQLPVRLTQGEYNVDVQVMVQKDAPYALLLGTDVQLPLGFSLLRKESDCRGMELITGKWVDLSAESSKEQQIEPGTIDSKEAQNMVEFVQEKPAPRTS